MTIFFIIYIILLVTTVICYAICDNEKQKAGGHYVYSSIEFGRFQYNQLEKRYNECNQELERIRKSKECFAWSADVKNELNDEMQRMESEMAALKNQMEAILEKRKEMKEASRHFVYYKTISDTSLGSFTIILFWIVGTSTVALVLYGVGYWLYNSFYKFPCDDEPAWFEYPGYAIFTFAFIVYAIVRIFILRR